jgi:hypothetical protein
MKENLLGFLKSFALGFLGGVVGSAVTLYVISLFI